MQKQKSRFKLNLKRLFCCIKSGDYLLSHAVARAVPLAQEGLTSVFGMGTGVTPPTESPENLNKLNRQSRVSLVSYDLPAKLALSKSYGQASGLISTGQLNVLLRLHIQPINVVVFHESHREHSSPVGLRA